MKWLFITTKTVIDDNFNNLLDGHRKFNITKTNRGKKCTFKECTHAIEAILVTRYAKCTSDACRILEKECEVNYKIEQCETSKITKFYWKGAHILSDSQYQVKTTRTPTKFTLNDTERDFVDCLLRAGMKPKKIYHEIINRPDFKNKPTLKWIQNYVSFQKSNNKDDEISEILRTLNGYVRKDNSENADPFVIGVDENNGVTAVGTGSDMDPFVVGFTSAGLLKKMQDFKVLNLEAMLHIDATYKITKESYPLLVIGITDISRRFHLLALYIVSQTTELIVNHCLRSLFDAGRSLYPDLVDWEPTYTMSDADQALYNSLHGLFPDSTHLTCYFHMRKNIREMARSLDGSQYKL